MIYILLVGISLVFVLFFYSLIKLQSIEEENKDNYDDFKS